jgi:hypothetical protein
MSTAFVFFGTLLVSLFVALLAALQLADFFNANQEFILVLLLPVIAAVSMTAFAIAYAVGRTRTIAATAIGLAVLALVLAAAPGLVQSIAGRSTNPYAIGIENLTITLELLIPALLTVLIQWGLVRRRWLRVRGAEDLTRWPWVTTVVAGLVILNPLGLAVVSGALAQSGTDWLRELWTIITAAGVAMLIVLGLIEYYIRGRMLRRRLASGLMSGTQASNIS